MINNEFEALSAARIKAALPPELRTAPIYVFQTIDSTNSHAKALALEGAVHGTMVLSEEQIAGRGRRGKSFFSPKDSGLYMSLLLRPETVFFDEQLITITAAAAVCRALESTADVCPRIKWVNDIYLSGKKVCGILCEKVLTPNGEEAAVIVGIGVNCAPSAFPSELCEIAGSLNTDVSRNELAAAITAELNEMLLLDASRIMEEYRLHSLMSNKRVRFTLNGEPYEATVIGIADNGNLLVSLDSGENLSLSSGEISVKGIGEWL